MRRHSDSDLARWDYETSPHQGHGLSPALESVGLLTTFWGGVPILSPRWLAYYYWRAPLREERGAYFGTPTDGGGSARVLGTADDPGGVEV